MNSSPVLEKFLCGIIRTNFNLEILEVDGGVEKAFNCLASDVVGRSIEAIISASDSQGRLNFHKRLSEYQDRPIDVYPIILAVSATTLLSRLRIFGEQDGWSFFVEIISDEHNLLHRLRQNELKLRAIIQGASDGIVHLSDDNRILEFNPIFYEIMNFKSVHDIALSEEAVYGRDFFDLVKAGFFMELRNNFDQFKVRVIAERYKSEGWFHSKYLSVEVTPMYLNKKEYSGSMVTIRDLTANHEITKLNAEIESQREKNLESSKMAALGEMAAGVAHEINSPLAIITTLADQLIELITTENCDKNYTVQISERIRGTAVRIAKIVASLRAFSRDASGDLFTLSPAIDVLRGTLELCSERFRLHNIKLDVSEVDENLKVFCRPSEISQVLLNLLNNAYDAVEKLEDRWVRVSVSAIDNDIVFSIVDSGAGIPEAVRAKLFQPFFTTKEIGKGTGIGLGISRRIAENHKGTLTLDIEHPNTRFELRIPKK